MSDFSVGRADAAKNDSGSSGDSTINPDSTADDAPGADTTIDDSTLSDAPIDSTITDSRLDSRPTETALDTPDTTACPTGTLACGAPASCTATKDDPEHCTALAGSCGAACPTSQFCKNGSCECRPGTINCGGGCVDISGDQNFCGTSCGATTVCAGGAAKLCVSGVCTSATVCSGGRGKCDKSCFDFNNDANHCGSCTTSCTANELCIGGLCKVYAPAIDCSSATACDCSGILALARACDPLTGSTGHPLCVQAAFCPVAPWK